MPGRAARTGRRPGGTAEDEVDVAFDVTVPVVLPGEGGQAEGVGVQRVLMAEEAARLEGGTVAHDLHGDGLRRGDLRVVGAQPVVGERHVRRPEPVGLDRGGGAAARPVRAAAGLCVPAALSKTMTTSRASRVAPVRVRPVLALGTRTVSR